MGVLMNRLIALIAVALLSSPSFAGLVTYTASADPNLSPDANSSLGGNINFWTVTSGGNVSTSGSFGGASNWGLYSNAASNQATATSVSFSTLSGVGKALNQAGEYVQIVLDHGSIQSGGSVGVFVRNTTGAAMSTLFFNGGATFYQVTDQSGTNSDTTQGFTSSPLTIRFQLNNATGSYTLTVGTNSFTRQLFGTNIDSIAVFNNNAGSGGGADVLFNNVQVSAVPEPSSVIFMTICASAGAHNLLKRHRRKQAIAKASQT